MPTAPHPRMSAEFARLLDDVSRYLNWKKEDGILRLETVEPAPLRASPRPETRSSEGALPSRPRRASPRPQAPAEDAAPSAPPPPTGGRAADTAAQLERIAATVAACTQCPLHTTRSRTVPGQGNPAPQILFVGEGPGADEDQQGLAFVGRAGQLLTRMIEAMGLTRDEVFITNIVKCRPPGNRVPDMAEMNACMPYLHQQIALLKPAVIVALGATAVKGLIPSALAITQMRGTWQTFDEIPLMPTFHPAYLLRNPPAKAHVWKDLKEVLRRLGRPAPPPV